MPNWCSSIYHIEGSTSDVKKLKTIIQSLEKRKKPFIKNGFGNLWLGCVVEKLGRKWEECPGIRGDIQDWNFNPDSCVLTLYMETAWGHPYGFKQLLDSLGYQVYYQEIEEGMAIYNTNDVKGKYFPERYYLDSDYEPCYYETDKELIDAINSHCDTNIKTFDEIDEVLDAWNEAHPDENYLYLHIFRVVEDD